MQYPSVVLYPLPLEVRPRVPIVLVIAGAVQSHDFVCSCHQILEGDPQATPEHFLIEQSVKLIGSTVDPFPSRLEKQEREFRSRESDCFEERFSGLLEERRSPFQAHFRGDRPELGGRLAPITSASRNSRIRTR